MNKQTGGPAFPVAGYQGMTLRDYFAAKAMQSLFEGAVADAITLDEDIKDIDCDIAAKIAYTMADAMLRERVK